jgi:hypothetical protein
MENNYTAVLVAKDYDKVDGFRAYKSQTKLLSLENETSEIIAKVWSMTDDQTTELSTSLPLHQVLDMTIFICSGLLHFKEAYRYPKLYNPDSPYIERIGLQGSAMTVSVCTENQNIDEEIQSFTHIINNQGEILGERLRVLSRMLKEMGY